MILVSCKITSFSPKNCLFALVIHLLRDLCFATQINKNDQQNNTYRTYCKSKSHDHTLYIMHSNSLWLLGICFTLNSVSSLELHPLTTFCTQKLKIQLSREQSCKIKYTTASTLQLQLTLPLSCLNPSLEVRDHLSYGAKWYLQTIQRELSCKTK